MGKKEIPTLQEIIEMVGDPKEIEVSLEERPRNIEYFVSNYETLSRDYPDEWIAISNQRVVGHDRNYESLLESFKGRRVMGVYIERTYVREKPPEPRTHILPAA